MSKLLIVEDNADYRELLISFLENEGYEVTAVNDGESAVVSANDTVFDLIILDLMLPGMDGYEVCRRIRENSGVVFCRLMLLDIREIAQKHAVNYVQSNEIITRCAGFRHLAQRS